MPDLFEPCRINEMEIKNRFVRSATYEAFATPDGKVEDRLLDCMVRLAQGGVGLIIASHAYVTRQGQAGPRQVGIYSDEMIDGLKKLTNAVHDNGSLVMAQVAHAGQRGLGKGKDSPLGPSEVVEEDIKKAGAMGIDDIERTIQAFGKAAGRAVKSGFDGVQIHSAHSYLLSQFLSPYYNKREDEFGGTIENRARFMVRVYEEIRKRVGEAFPVTAKINSEDFVEGGLSVDEMLYVCRILEEEGIDAIEMSGGTFDSGKNFFSRKGTAKSVENEAYYRDAARKFKEKMGIPLILVGGFLSYEVAQETIASGLADFVSFSRPLIREPNLAARWQSGDTKKAACISCNKCFRTLFTEDGLYCSAEKPK